MGEFERAVLQRHLGDIHCGGEVEEVILRPDLSATAMTPDRNLVVDVPAPENEDEALLGEEVGIINVKMLLQALGLEDNLKTRLVVDDERLILDEGEAGQLSFVTADPTTINTIVEDSQRDHLLQMVEGVEGVPIGSDLIHAVTSRQKLLGAIAIRLDCGPDGTKFTIGPETGHYGNFFKEDLQTEDEEYRLVVRAGVLVSVFDRIPDPGEATISIGGIDSVVGIQFGDHTYLVGTMAEEDRL